MFPLSPTQLHKSAEKKNCIGFRAVLEGGSGTGGVWLYTLRCVRHNLQLRQIVHTRVKPKHAFYKELRQEAASYAGYTVTRLRLKWEKYTYS